MTSTSEMPATTRRLPNWARLIVSLVVLALTACILIVCSLPAVIQKVSKEAIDPKLMPLVAAEIGLFPEPLPAGYKYEFACRLPLPNVQIRHEPDKQLIQIDCQPDVAEEDPQMVLNRAIDFGDQFMSVNKLHSVKTRASATIAGCEMPYIVGEFVDDKSKNVEGMIACLCVKEKRKTILIYARQPLGSPYNLQVTMDLLKSIKSF